MGDKKETSTVQTVKVEVDSEALDVLQSKVDKLISSLQQAKELILEIGQKKEI